MKGKHFLCLIILCGIWNACDAPGNKTLPKQTKSAFIWGGKLVPRGKWPQAVALIYFSDIDGQAYLKCSGVLVHPLLVLTAAHCVQKELDRHPQDFSRRFRISLGEEIGPPYYEIQRAGYHPDFKKALLGYKDIAYLLLANPIDNIPILKVLDDESILSHLSHIFPEISIVGFGLRENGEQGSKYEAAIGVGHFNSSEILLKNSRSDSCFGDSGGPSFFRLPGSNDGWRVLGISSRGLTRKCGEGSYYSLIKDSLCWIKEASGIDLSSASSRGPCDGETPNSSSPGPEWEDFIQNCREKHLNPSQLHTLGILKRITNTQSCEETYLKLMTLKKLELNSNYISDLSPLSVLHQLEELNLSDNRISLLEPLLNLKSLKFLHLAFNRIPEYSWKTLEPLEMAGLTIFGKFQQNDNFLNTPFWKICLDPFSSQTQGTTVRAMAKALNPGAVHGGENNCQELNQTLWRKSFLDLSGQHISDLTPLKNLPQIRHLNLGGNSIEDLEPLSTMENLQELNLDNNQIKNVDSLKNLWNLKRVSLKQNHISDFSPLEKKEKSGVLILGKDEQNGI